MKVESASKLTITKQRNGEVGRVSNWHLHSVGESCVPVLTAEINPVKELVARLDELGLPNDATNRQCQQALKRDRGRGTKADVMASATRIRRARDPTFTND